MLKKYIYPSILFVSTIFTTLVAGRLLSTDLNSNEGILQNLVSGFPFSLAVMTIYGGHGLGHFFTARKASVSLYPPYFIPIIGIMGTKGAYTKMRWPINDRSSLISIFATGPILSFVASLAFYLYGLSLSRVTVNDLPDDASLTLGHSIITKLSELIIHGNLPVTQDIILHPLAFAGWGGFLYTFWHLLPVGRLDGGRIAYALFGLHRLKIMSIVSIMSLIVLSYFWHGWIGFAIFCILCMYRLGAQYSVESIDQPLDKKSIILAVTSLIILVITFPPMPFEYFTKP